MTCLECGGRVTTRRVRAYRYDIGGLSNVTLHRGVQISRCEECGVEEVSIPRIEELHKLIAEALVEKPKALAPAEIRFLRKYLGWSGQDFAAYMGMARETVSRWESGTALIGSSADRLLRMYVVKQVPVQDYSLDVLKDLERDEKGRPPAKLQIWAKGKHWKAPQVA